jgi:hypothetical protein
MRIQLPGGLLVAALMTSAAGHAQTWESPLPFNANPYASAIDSCAFPPQMLYMDNGAFPIYAPAVIYHVYQLQLGRRPPLLHAWSVTLTPQAWTDLSLWVCQQKDGYFVNQCVDASDDYGNGVPEHVTVPAQAGGYYVIVAGNIEQQSPMCGPYVLTAIH